MLGLFIVMMLFALIFGIGTKVLIAHNQHQPADEIKVAKLLGYGATSLFLFLAVVAVLTSSIHFVPAGNAGLVTRFGAEHQGYLDGC